jgi:hypothetical protein
VARIFTAYSFTGKRIFGEISVFYCVNASRNFTVTVLYYIIKQAVLGVIYQSQFLSFLLDFPFFIVSELHQKAFSHFTPPLLD